MKKRLFAVLLSVLMIFGMFCVMGSAEEEITELPEGFDEIYEGKVTTKEIYVTLPDGYEAEMWDEQTFLSYVNLDSDYIYVSCVENKDAPKGIKALTQEQATKICTDLYEDILSETWYEEDFTLEIKESEKKTINGVLAHRLNGTVATVYSGEEETSYYAFEAYLLATKENIFMIFFEDNSEIFHEQEDVAATIPTIAINGTYFDGEKNTLQCDFENAPDFESCVVATINDYWYGDYDDSVGEMMMYGTVTMIIGVIFALLVVAAFVALCVMNYTKNKKLEAYERMYGPLNYVTTPMYVPVAVPQQPQPPVQQNAQQPAPPPMQPPVVPPVQPPVEPTVEPPVEPTVEAPVEPQEENNQ